MKTINLKGIKKKAISFFVVVSIFSVIAFASSTQITPQAKLGYWASTQIT